MSKTVKSKSVSVRPKSSPKVSAKMRSRKKPATTSYKLSRLFGMQELPGQPVTCSMELTPADRNGVYNVKVSGDLAEKMRSARVGMYLRVVPGKITGRNMEIKAIVGISRNPKGD
ncbi:hypothetical protein LCGC14_2313980, partial [marine sediment metagenome]